VLRVPFQPGHSGDRERLLAASQARSRMLDSGGAVPSGRGTTKDVGRVR